MHAHVYIILRVLLSIIQCIFLQLNKCLSENQKLWKDRVTALEEKIDVTIKQKEKVRRHRMSDSPSCAI